MVGTAPRALPRLRRVTRRAGEAAVGGGRPGDSGTSGGGRRSAGRPRPIDPLPPPRLRAVGPLRRATRGAVGSRVGCQQRRTRGARAGRGRVMCTGSGEGGGRSTTTGSARARAPLALTLVRELPRTTPQTQSASSVGGTLFCPGRPARLLTSRAPCAPSHVPPPLLPPRPPTTFDADSSPTQRPPAPAPGADRRLMASAFDPTQLGLPAGFRMTNYSKLKG